MWAAAMVAGIPDELYWDLTAEEVAAVLDEREILQKREDRRTGLVAATLVNLQRRRGSRLIQPGDFFRPPRRARDFMDPAAAVKFMDRWAAQQNAPRRAPAPDAGGAA